jgi:hypothetical protein
MIRNLLIFLLALIPVAASAELQPGVPNQDGLTLERRADQMEVGYVGEYREMTLLMINAEGQEAMRQLSYEALEEPNRKDKTVIRFTFPPDTKGTTLLTHERGEEDDDQWLYLPSLKRVKRIASSNKSGSFMGSEFAYEDMVVRQFEKYHFRYLGDELVDDRDCYVIERTPKSADSGYSKVIRWLQKDNLQELKSDFYDRKGQLLKQRILEGHHQVDGYWRVSKIIIKNVQTRKSSVLTFDEVQLKVSQPERKFSVRGFGGAL